ncbi:MAG TPA: hypothetical protein VKV16_07245 [Solirubrobacteraceae bacterium]|nr:hypothetical protein [Solirubrobacteraceae bacterium]
MHAAYATAWLAGDASRPSLAAAEPDVEARERDACEPRLATPVLVGPPPPQPATSAPAAASTAAAHAARRPRSFVAPGLAAP